MMKFDLVICNPPYHLGNRKELWNKGKYDEAVLAEIVGKDVYLVDLYR